MEILILLLALFVLSLFLGVELITKVPPTLHTPLMSGTNAVSGITLVGALLAAGADRLADAGQWVGLYCGDSRDDQCGGWIPCYQPHACHV